ncbi:MAG: hypothetical protein ACREH5_06850 [Candidatus Omnitrophota bacterium]
MPKRLSALLLSFASLCFFVSPVFAGTMEFVKVFGIQGEVEIRGVSDKGWRPLERDTLLEEGDQVRVNAHSALHLVLDRSLESMVTLGENARLKVLRGPVASFSLLKGALFIYREKEVASGSHFFFRILTRDVEVRMKEGGGIIESDGRGTWVRVFADRAEVTNRFNPSRKPKPEPVEEAFKFFASVHSRQTSLERISASDYDAWQPWIKKIYVRKDLFAAEELEKEMSSWKTRA